MPKSQSKSVRSIAVVGLGYVGLPLLLSLSEHFEVLGLDRVEEKLVRLRSGIDQTGELTPDQLKKLRRIPLTHNFQAITTVDVIVVCVPTPVDEAKNPDLTPLLSACHEIGANLRSGQIVVFESTVYPGCTRSECVPILEARSNLKLADGDEIIQPQFDSHFSVGYSPERVSPGDKDRKLGDVVKIVSASNRKAAQELKDIYGKIISAGIYMAESIEIAEAAKIIENTQRDLNIALINEFSMILEKLKIPTRKVLSAASTKWNFHPYEPGLVGGHCIGVDPYYLTYCAQQVGIESDVITAGRSRNDSMPQYYATRIHTIVANQYSRAHNCRVLIFGLTFKENCPDTRNSKALELLRHLEGMGHRCDCYDPVADFSEIDASVTNVDINKAAGYDILVFAVRHQIFQSVSLETLSRLCLNGAGNPLIYDIKGVFAGVTKIENSPGYFTV